MKQVILFFLVILSSSFAVNALPPAYAIRVTFKDKNGTLSFADSLQFLSQKALDRRSKQGIALDSSDLPVVTSYINQAMTTGLGIKVHNVSKWFNQIVIITNDSNKITDLAALPMVQSVKLVGRWTNGVYYKSLETNSNKFPAILSATSLETASKKTRPGSSYYGLTFQQINIMHGDYLHDLGYKGEGMNIAVMDVNFRYANTCSAYDSINQLNRIKDTKDFVKDTSYVFSPTINISHGMNVLGCMAGNIPGTYVGTAPNANFYLYITEQNNSMDMPIEEDNWVSGIERADSIGVDILNSSLGYNEFETSFTSSNYTYASLDGTTSLVAKAANKAVTKGIFVVNAQGNEGLNSWHYLLTPADADSVYSVGSVDGSGVWGGSGYGPTFDSRTKPDGMAVGKGSELIGDLCTVGSSNGSSFASPILCGAIACFMQACPQLNVWQVRQLVKMSSDRYSNPNNTHGYGIPNFQLAHSIVLGTSDVQNIDYTFSLYPNPCKGSFDLKSYDPSIQLMSYKMYDMHGTIVSKSNTLSNVVIHSDDLQTKPSGVYYLVITTLNKVYTAKIVKE